MTNDLYLTKKSMRQRVIDFCSSKKGFITSIDIENLKDEIRHKEGNVEGILRIHREWRALARTEKNPNGILRRLDKEEKLFRGFDKRFATYEFIINA